MGSRSRNEKETTQIKKGPWTKEEDQKLLSYIQEHGHGSWRSLPEKAGLQRCGKSCRLRWTNYLRPDIKRGKFSPHEEKTIIRLHALLGNRWSSIAAYLPKRTDNEIKNYWNTRLKKRLTRMGIDPTTHKPKNNPPAPNLTHMAQWETARLEAEARLSLLHRFKPSSIAATMTNTSNNNYYNNAMPLTPPARPCLDVLKVWQATSYSANFSFDSTQMLSSVSDGVGVLAADIDCMQTTKGEIERSSIMHGLDRENHQLYGCDYNVACDNNSMMTNRADDHDVGDYEESKRYWNELLNMVMSSSPLS